MRFLALVFALVASSAFACDAVSPKLNLENLTVDFGTLTGNYTMKVAFADLANSECPADRSGIRSISNAATVRVYDRDSGKTLQTYTTSVTPMEGDEMIIASARPVVGSGFILSANTEGKVFVHIERMGIPAEATLRQ